MAIQLEKLDNADVTVDMDVQGRQVSFLGQGRYERSPAGNRLHIEVADPAGHFTIVLEEDQWNGTISQDPGGAFRIRLQSP